MQQFETEKHHRWDEDLGEEDYEGLADGDELAMAPEDMMGQMEAETAMLMTALVANDTKSPSFGSVLLSVWSEHDADRCH